MSNSILYIDVKINIFDLLSGLDQGRVADTGGVDPDPNPSI